MKLIKELEKVNQEVFYIDIKPKYYNIQFIYNKKNIQVTSNNNMLFNELYNTKLPTIKILNK